MVTIEELDEFHIINRTLYVDLPSLKDFLHLLQVSVLVRSYACLVCSLIASKVLAASTQLYNLHLHSMFRISTTFRLAPCVHIICILRSFGTLRTTRFDAFFGAIREDSY